MVVRTERIQAPNILDKMISKENYFAMLKYAKDTGRIKLYHIMRTIAGTGLRVGEFKACDGRCYHRWVYPNLEQGKI